MNDVTRIYLQIRDLSPEDMARLASMKLNGKELADVLVDNRTVDEITRLLHRDDYELNKFLPGVEERAGKERTND